MVDEDRLRVWAARLAAPVAFLVAAIVLVWLVQSAISSNGTEEASPPGQSGPTVTEPGPTTTTTGSRRKRFYKVRNGDTLESIAAKSDTTVEELTRLNPGIDPLSLNPGERIRVA